MKLIYKQTGHICINIFGIKIKFKNPLINQLQDCCIIENFEYIKKQGTKFAHPIGIVIAKDVKIGKNCVIFQNVTIGAGTDGKVPKIGNNVIFYANAIAFGDITIGDNVIIGAGCVVTKSIPENSVVVGNPARIIRQNENKS